MEDDDSTPQPVPISPHKAEMAALADLALALNGTSLNITRLISAVSHVGLSPAIRSTIGREIREAGSRMERTANIVDPQPAGDLPPAPPTSSPA